MRAIHAIVFCAAASSASVLGFLSQEVTVRTKGKAVVRAQQPAVIRVTVNDEEVAFADAPPRMVKRRVMVPLRGVFEKLGAYVEWRPEEQMVIATKGDKKIECWIGKELAAIDDEQVKLDAPPVLVAARTYVPLRFISEALGAKVSWEAPTVVIRIR